jgi:hypothetical protein
MKKTEQRTQLYLTTEQHRAVRELAHRKGSSLAGIVREALKEYLRNEASVAAPLGQEDPFLSLLGGFALPALASGQTLNDAIDASVYDEEVESWSSLTPLASSPASMLETSVTARPRGRSAPSRNRGKRSSRRTSSSPKR